MTSYREGSSHPIIGPVPLLGIYIRKGCHGGNKGLDKQETRGALAVHTCGQRQAKGFLFFWGGGEPQQKNWGTAQSEQKPDKTNNRIANRILPFKRTPTETGPGKQS